MPSIYGTVDLIAAVRSQLSTHLNALKTAMTAGSISPAFALVMNDHWSTVALASQFPAVSIGIEQIENPFVGASSGTHRSDFIVRCVLRILIGRPNIFMDEVKYNQLTQSVINYLEERRKIYESGTDRILWVGAAESRPLRVFDDTRTMGGELVLMLRATGTFTRA